MPHKHLRLLLACVSLVLLAACSAQPQPPETVEITLVEFGIQSTATTFDVGKPYRFVITNAGALSHEFSIMPPMPPGMDMDMADHSMEGHAMMGALIHIGEDQLAPGATAVIEYTFTEPTPAGSIEFACHLSGHYEGGMFAPITVGT